MTARVESPKDILNETQPKTIETKNRFEYLCFNATKAYFKEVVSEHQTYITVIAKIALLAFPLIAAFALLEAAFDLLMAPITFIANCIAGPQEIPQEIPPVNPEDSNEPAPIAPPIPPATPYKVTQSVDDIGLGRKRATIQRTGSLDQLPLAVTFHIPEEEAKKPNVLIPIVPSEIDSAPTTPTTDLLPAEPAPTDEPEIPPAPTTPIQNPLPATLTPPQKVTPLYFNKNLNKRTRQMDALLDFVPLPPPTPPSPSSTVTKTDALPADTKQSTSFTKRALSFLSRRNSTE